MITWYDKDGIPIGLELASALLNDQYYRHVAKTKIIDAARLPISFDISTVWLGLNQNWGDGPPLIFETMVIDGNGVVVDVRRHATLAQAKAEHVEMVVIVSATLDDPIVMDATRQMPTDQEP